MNPSTSISITYQLRQDSYIVYMIIFCVSEKYYDTNLMFGEFIWRILKSLKILLSEALIPVPLLKIITWNCIKYDEIGFEKNDFP